MPRNPTSARYLLVFFTNRKNLQVVRLLVKKTNGRQKRVTDEASVTNKKKRK